MSNLVIVAIPAEDDYVWKISSEKVPHMTLLFLGDETSAETSKIEEFLQHAVNVLELGPFGLDVDYRGTLGVDNADVVFFHQNWALRRIAEFRDQLLKNGAINTAYNSTQQFDGPWQPHLTLGYPKKPAKPDTRDYPGVRWVQFDRIALWTTDFAGPEFRLQYNWDWEEVMMSDAREKGLEFLTHHGVKGMRWGVRRNRPAVDAQARSVVNAGLRGKTKVKATGGQAHPAADDAVKAAVQRQKLRKSGPAALSNKDLKELQERLQLEVNVSRLDKEHVGAGRKFVRKHLTRGRDEAAQRAVTEALKKAATVAAVA